MACAPNPSLGSFSKAKVPENLFVIQLGPKSVLPDAAVPGNTGTYDVWQGAGAFVQFEVNPSAVKAACGLIEVDASNEYSGTQENQEEPSPAARPATGDHQLLVVCKSASPSSSINSQIKHCNLRIFQGEDTIQPELTEIFKAKTTSVSERCPQGTKVSVKEELKSKQTHQTSIGHGGGKSC